ncbi:receptor-like protein EIX2 [Rosa sericea]
MLFSIMSGRRIHSVLVGLLCLVIASAICCSSSVGTSSILCLESERHALLRFKQGLVDESNALASWKSEKDCCKWRGIACNNQTGHVITLNLCIFCDDYMYAATPLIGEIDPSLLELRHLNHLDLSFNDFGGMIPKFIGSLSQLKELKLAQANFSGSVPPQLGNLSNLHTLDLSWNEFLSSENIEWLSHLSSLRYLNMSGVDLSKVVNWPQSLSKLTSLIELQLSWCRLPDVNLRSLSFINSSTSLQVLDLSQNSLINSSIFHWIANVSNNFVHIQLSDNDLQGPIPAHVFTSMVSLVSLDLSGNLLEGGMAKAFQNLCSLESLVLASNQFSENIQDSLETLSCAENTLESLDLSDNWFWGSFPELTGFSKLRELRLHDNTLNRSIPESVGQLSSLEHLDLSGNSLNAVITEAHFLNLSSLKHLDVSNNTALSINLSSDWNPPFQLDTLGMSSCKVGPAFPKWIQMQRNLTRLSLDNASISDSLPSNFWDLFSGLEELDLSRNKIHGRLPDLPSFPPGLITLYLSNNMFSGSLSSLCATQAPQLNFLDLSENLLSGELPNCWMSFQLLDILYLGKNKLSGKLPSSLGHLEAISVLGLHSNNFSGELPSLKNCARLTILDLGNNNLSGKIPSWINQNLKYLRALRLRSNMFNGIIPFSMCGLTTIHVLDLSQNNISGALPHCFNNILALADDATYDIMNVELVWKGIEIEFGENLQFLRSIDISSNYLVGEIPENITSMLKLNSLNLSRNNLTGKLPENFGNLKKLESLDLSRNQISGRIPTSFSSLNFLEVLDVSHNHLSGEIPLGTQLQTFNASAYMGNLGLCGPPLTPNCSGDGTTQVDDNKEHDNDGIISLGFFISTVLGFITGFWVVCGSLVLKSSWRYAYFKFLDDSRDWVYVKAVVYKAKMQKRLQR